MPERWTGSWEDCLPFALVCDDRGIEFMLPIGRWKGYGGETDYMGTTLKTITWATGLPAQSKQLIAFGTVPAPLFHPLIAGKQFVTTDQVSGGRFGLNLVVGWNEDEFQMFGVTQREHEQRYEYAQEWLDAVKLAWGPQEDFEYNGKFINLKKVRAKPKPYGGSRPLIINIALNLGASYRGLHDSIINYLGNESPQMLLCLHEEAAVAIAHGYAKVTGKAMACAVHANIGLFHATMAIINAWCDRMPIVILGLRVETSAARVLRWT